VLLPDRGFGYAAAPPRSGSGTWPGPVPGKARRHRGVDDDCHGRHGTAARYAEQGLPGMGLHVGGIHDRGEAAPQPGFHEQVQDRHRASGSALIAGIAGDRAAEGIEAEYLAVLPGEPGKGRFPASGGPDEHDEARPAGGRSPRPRHPGRIPARAPSAWARAEDWALAAADPLYRRPSRAWIVHSGGLPAAGELGDMPPIVVVELIRFNRRDIA